MGYRVNKIRVVMEVYQEFEGTSVIDFNYQPADNADPLVVEAFKRNSALLQQAVAQAGPAQPFGD